MSFLASEWAGEAATAADAYERLILIRLANRADDDGCGAYLSVGSLARTALCDTETVKRRLKALRTRGVIALGDQSLAAHIRADKRPKVYDLQIPVKWYSAAQLEKVNQQRAELGKPALTAAARPPLPDAPVRVRRADHGRPNPARRPKRTQAAADAGALQEPSLPIVDNSSGGSQRAADGGSTRAVDGGSLSRATGALVEPQTNQPKPVLGKEHQPTNASARDEPPPAGEPDQLGWLVGDPPETDTTAAPDAEDSSMPSPGEQLLRALPTSHRLATHALPRAAATVTRALRAGMSRQAIIGYLTGNMSEVHNPAGVVLHRLASLANDLDHGAPAAARPGRPDWCGDTGAYRGQFDGPCDAVTRQRERESDRAMLRCPVCHPYAASRAGSEEDNQQPRSRRLIAAKRA